MNDNLMLVLGPVLALAVARLFGPLRVLPALGAAVVGQIVVFGGYATWRHVRATRALEGRAGTERVAVAWVEPTFGGRLVAITLLVGIAAAIAVLALAVQYLIAR
jgi:hypothetical protein